MVCPGNRSSERSRLGKGAPGLGANRRPARSFSQWDVTAERKIPTVRLPQDALRDYAIASRALFDGRLIQVGRSADNRAVLLAPLRRAFGAVGVTVLALSAVVATLLAWQTTRPLREVSETARRILDTGDSAARVRVPNAVANLRPSSASSILCSIRMPRMYTFSGKRSTISPTTFARLSPGSAAPPNLPYRILSDPAEARAALADCVNECDRVLHLLEALLDVTAAEAGALKLDLHRLDVRTLTEHAVDLYREVAEEKKITLTLDQPTPAEIEGDPIRLGQAINNVLDNALKYTPTAGHVRSHGYIQQLLSLNYR